MRIGIALFTAITLTMSLHAQEEATSNSAAASGESLALTPLGSEEIQARVTELGRAALGPVTPLPPFGGDPMQVVVRLSNPFDRDVAVRFDLVPGHGDWHMEPPAVERVIPPMTTLEVSPEFTPPADSDSVVNPWMQLTMSVPTGDGATENVTVVRGMAWITQVRLLAQTRAQRVVDGYRSHLEGWEAARSFEPLAWDPSEPSADEVVPEIKYAWSGRDAIYLFLRFEDTDLCDNPDNSGSEPVSDAVIVQGINASGERHDFAFFPLREGERRHLVATPGSPENQWPVAPGLESATRRHNAFENIQLWELGLPIESLFGPDWAPAQPLSINILWFDNDGGGETTVRSWAPQWGPEWWVRMSFGPRASDF